MVLISTVAITLTVILGCKGIPPRHNQAPVARFRTVGEKMPIGNDSLRVTFDASESADDSGIEAYVWDFGDGTAVQAIRGPGGSEVEHMYYVSLGAATVRLVVRDDDGELSEPAVVVVPLTINHQPFATFFAEPTSGDSPLLVEFNAQGSYDPDPGETAFLEYVWRFGDGSKAQRTNSPTKQYVFESEKPRSFVVELVVSDGQTQSSPAYGVIRVQ